MANFAINISKRLKIARLASGYNSAKKFTEKYSIPPSTYSQHENAKRILSIENIMYYSKLFNVDPAWLMTGKGNPCGDNTNQADLEEKILAEQANLEKIVTLEAYSIPLISMKKKYSNVNIHIFKKLLNILLPLLKDIPDPKIEEVIDFCFNLYNRIVEAKSHNNEQDEMIIIGYESFFKGLGIRVTDELLMNLALI